jgi:hypothetical protein
MNSQKYPPLDFSHKKSYNFTDVPGLKESGWTMASYLDAKEGEEKTFD